MNIKYIFIGIALLVVSHFILYFFNIDLFECFEQKIEKIKDCKKEEKKDEHIDKITNELTQSLEQLKEINNS